MQEERQMMRTSATVRLMAAAMAVGVCHWARGAATADWKNFTSSSTQTWNLSSSWTAGTGIPTSGSALVINFDPSKTGTTTGTSGTISNGFTSQNDLGTVQLNTLNFAGVSSASARIITLLGGTLQFSSSPVINNTTGTSGSGGLVTYAINCNVLLDDNLSINASGTGVTTMLSTPTTGNTLSSSTTGLKTITVTGGGSVSLGGVSATVISDGSGKVGVTMAGSGTLTMGGTNTFTGDVLIKSGTVIQNSSSAGTSTAFGAGAIKLGDTTGSASALLQLTSHGSGVTYGNAITVQSGSSGTKTIENVGGNYTATTGGLLTVNGNLTLKYSGGQGGGITVGSSTGASWLTGAGTVTSESNATGTGLNAISGTNSGFTGGVVVNTGTLQLKSAGALSSSNVVSVNAASTLALNNVDQTIAGLNDVTGGGTVTNTGASARTLTLGGSGNYSFSGGITAATPANLGLTIALTSGGKQTLSGSSFYTGATAVNSGTLVVGGSLAAGSTVTVAGGATLAGGGSAAGSVTVNGTLAPGNSIGTLNTGNLRLGATSTLDIELGRSAGIPDSDRANVTGTVTIDAGANLNLSIYSGFSNPVPGDIFYLIGNNNDGSDVVAGTFAKLNGVATTLAEGSTFSWNSQSWKITYAANYEGSSFTGGNDVAITVIPEPATATMMALLGATVLAMRRRRMA